MRKKLEIRKIEIENECILKNPDDHLKGPEGTWRDQKGDHKGPEGTWRDLNQKGLEGTSMDLRRPQDTLEDLKRYEGTWGDMKGP